MSEAENAQQSNESAAAQEAAAPLGAAATGAEGAQEQASQAATGAEADGQQQQKAEGDDKGKPEGAPEKYDFKPPEGQTFDDQVIAKFADTAKALNLTQAQAQQILDDVVPAMQARQQAQMEATRNEWVQQAKQDTEYGGDKLAENLTVANKALHEFASPDLIKLLEESGLANHPEVIRMFWKTGKAISEDGFVAGGGKPAAEQTLAQRLYPNMKP